MKWTTSLLFASLLTVGCALQSIAGAYEDGVSSFNKKDYGSAIRSFTQATKDNPHNASSYYYIASSFYSMGNVAKAEPWFRYVVTYFPISPEATLSKSVLQRIHPDSPQGGTTSGAATTTGAAVASAQIGKKTVPESPADPATLIHVIRALADRPNVDKTFVDQVKDRLKTFPPGVIKLLSKHGAEVDVTPTMIDRYPEFANTKPRGYEDGMTYKTCPALFDGRCLVVAQYYFDSTDSLQSMNDAIGSLRHETGHAIDCYMGYLSHNDDFKHAYFLDLGKMEPETKQKLSYYTQKAEGGPSEAFAEICAGLYGGRTSSDRKTRNADVLNAFPLYSAKIKSAIESLQ